MVEICTWDEVFKRKKGSPNLIFLTLYWYLFNKTGCQTQIVEDMKELKKMEEFKDIPASLCEERNVTRYVRNMEEYNLIGIREIGNRRSYYQALSFFYIDRFCIKQPRLKSGSKGGTIEKHYREYKKCVRALRISFSNEENILSFDVQHDNSILPAQELVTEYSTEPRKFMKHLFLRKKTDYINLYFLILKTLSEVTDIMELDYFLKKEIIPDFDILNKERIYETGLDESFLLEKSRYFKWRPEDIQKEFKWNLSSHTRFLVSHMLNYIIPCYESLELGYSSFNKKTLEFVYY